MPENTVEILIRARDEATRVLQQTTAQVQQAAAGAEQASTRAAVGADRLAQSSLSASQRISALSATTRFASFGLVQELSPALGTTVTRMASLSTVAATTGNVLSGVLLAGGITAVISGLGLLIKHLKDTIDAENAYADAIEKGTLGPIAKRIEAFTKMRQAMDLARPSPADIAAAIGGVGPPRAGFEEEALAAARATAISIIRIQGEIVQGAKDVQEFINEQNRKRFDDDKKLRERIAENADAQIKSISDAQRRLIEAEGVITDEMSAALEAMRQQLEDKVAETEKTLQRLEDRRVAGLEEIRLSRLSAEAEGTIREEQAAQISALQQDFEERTVESLRRAQQPIVNAMTTLGHASADALFDAMTGRARTLGEAVKSLFEGLARDIFRNTLAQLFGGQAHGLSFQNLMSLGGGGGPFGRLALAAGVPGVGGLTGVDVATRAGAVGPGFGIGEEAAAGLPGAAGAGIPFGALAGIGIGALGILGASQAQDPLTGALSGGLGGLSAGLGVASLLGVGGAFLGPIGLVAGLGFGIFSGLRGRRRRKREEARQRKAAAQIALIQAADTLEELEALSTIGLEPEAAEALRQQATPLILAAGREEIAGAGSLAGIRDILARGVSPDVGGAELRLEAQRREQEILGDLEEIGGISIEDQLEGGVRRRTIVGPGAFGRARARQAGGDIILDATALRRMIRNARQSAPEVIDELARAIFERAGARRIVIEPSRL